MKHLQNINGEDRRVNNKRNYHYSKQVDRRASRFAKVGGRSIGSRVYVSAAHGHMAASLAKGVEDVKVTFEDQQHINNFARNNTRLVDLKDEIELKKKELQNLQDAAEDLMMVDDDSMLIPYQIGEVFIWHSQEEAQGMLENAKKTVEEEIAALEGRAVTIKKLLSELKVQLYAKFGTNINLEADEE